jgi:hypothetical protein
MGVRQVDAEDEMTDLGDAILDAELKGLKASGKSLRNGDNGNIKVMSETIGRIAEMMVVVVENRGPSAQECHALHAALEKRLNGMSCAKTSSKEPRQRPTTAAGWFKSPLASFGVEHISGNHIIGVALITACTIIGWQALRLKESAQRKLAESDAEVRAARVEQFGAVQDAKDAIALAQGLAEKVAKLEDAEKRLRERILPVQPTGKGGPK